MYPYNPYQDKKVQEPIQQPPQKQPSESFGHFRPYPVGPPIQLQQQMVSQPFVVYFLGVITGKLDTLKMEFSSNSAKNSTLLLLLLLLFNYFLYTGLFSIFPFTIDPEFLVTLLDQNLFTQDVGSGFNDQNFQQVFALTGLLSFVLANIILGVLAFSFLFNANKLPRPYKKALIISVASLTPIIFLELVRYVVLAFTLPTEEQTIFLIYNTESLAEYLGIIFNSNLGYNQGLRIILLLLRIAWTSFLMQRLFIASGIPKEKSFTYTMLFTLFAGGGFDLLNQIFYSTINP
jgi:hypothetical protein